MTSLAAALAGDASARLLAVHVDDVGMCHGANTAFLELFRAGAVTCGSVMVPCPWFREIADAAAADRSLDLGVHLTLTSEWAHYRWAPISTVSRASGLVDEQGFLPRTSLEVVQRAKPEEVEIELRAQIEMALAAGIDVTHLDAHMGTAFYPPFLPIYAKLAVDYRLPVFAFRPEDEVLASLGLTPFGPFLRSLVDELGEAGIPVLDGFCADSLSFAEGDGLAHNRRRLAKLGPGVSYLICHAAQGGEELTAVTPGSAHQRDFERAFYGGEAGRRELGSAGIRTAGMRALRALVRRGENP